MDRGTISLTLWQQAAYAVMPDFGRVLRRQVGLLINLLIAFKKQKECSSCDAGQYVNENNSGCIECAPGTFCENGFTFPCHAGFFQDEYGKAECKACPIGTYNPRENMETVYIFVFR